MSQPGNMMFRRYEPPPFGIALQIDGGPMTVQFPVDVPSLVSIQTRGYYREPNAESITGVDRDHVPCREDQRNHRNDH
jgi:hypothetical protein